MLNLQENQITREDPNLQAQEGLSPQIRVGHKGLQQEIAQQETPADLIIN